MPTEGMLARITALLWYTSVRYEALNQLAKQNSVTIATSQETDLKLNILYSQKVENFLNGHPTCCPDGMALAMLNRASSKHVA